MPTFDALLKWGDYQKKPVKKTQHFGRTGVCINSFPFLPVYENDFQILDRTLS
jgi:hypothetical protein